MTHDTNVMDFLCQDTINGVGVYTRGLHAGAPCGE